MIQAIDKPLNFKQQLFTEYYSTGETAGNATRAAVKAGYTWKFANQASIRLLGIVRIKKAIDKKMADLRQKTGITAERQLQRADDVYTQALENKHFTAALTALDQQNRHIGLYDADNASKADKTLNIVVFGQPAQLPAKTPESLPGSQTPILEADTHTDDREA
jgi:phage terminase small subunit